MFGGGMTEPSMKRNKTAKGMAIGGKSSKYMPKGGKG